MVISARGGVGRFAAELALARVRTERLVAEYGAAKKASAGAVGYGVYGDGREAEAEAAARTWNARLARGEGVFKVRRVLTGAGSRGGRSWVLRRAVRATLCARSVQSCTAVGSGGENEAE